MAPFDLVFIYQSRFPLVPALAMLAPFVFANILVSRLPLSLLFSVTIAPLVCSAADKPITFNCCFVLAPFDLQLGANLCLVDLRKDIPHRFVDVDPIEYFG